MGGHCPILSRRASKIAAQQDEIESKNILTKVLTRPFVEHTIVACVDNNARCLTIEFLVWGMARIANRKVGKAGIPTYLHHSNMVNPCKPRLITFIHDGVCE